MRDPSRIEALLSELADAWHKWPDQRFGQFLINLIEICECDLWYTEDDVWVVGIQAFIAGRNPKEAMETYTKEKANIGR